MTDPGPQPNPSEPELELETPPGLRLEHPDPGSVTVYVDIPRSTRLLLALPRLVFTLGMVVTILAAWRRHVFFAFWVLGFPLFRWLFGSTQLALFIGEQSLRMQGTRWFGGTLMLQRSEVRSFEIDRGSLFQAFQRVLSVRTVDNRNAPLLVGLSEAQAEFIYGGLQRWLAGDS